MIDVLLFVWAWLYAAIAIEAQAVQMMAKTAPPPKGVCCNYICNYITKEGEKLSGDVYGKEVCREG